MGFIKSEKSFLELLRDKTKKNKTLLIFDEAMTGFRVAMGGAQDVYKISPDLTALGKIIGGGLPVGAFGGDSKIMDQLAPDGPIYQAGTLSGKSPSDVSRCCTYQGTRAHIALQQAPKTLIIHVD